MSDFRTLGASTPVIRALEAHGIRAPFPIQTLVLPDAMAGHDVLAKSRTGSGKTLAFAIPIVETTDPKDPRPTALVLVPTRELASQVREDFEPIAKARGLRVAVAYGGVGIREQANRAAKAHILVATPGRLEDLAQRKLVKLDGIRVLVLDEADRMLDMGFQPQVDRIVRRVPKDRQTMFFSATLDGHVGFLASRYTTDAVRHEIETLIETVDEASHRFLPVPGGDKLPVLVDLLKEERGLALIFVRTKRGADRLVTRLKSKGVRAEAMHGDMRQQLRERTLAKFEAGSIDALVATDVAARGLDLDDITHVINYDPPEDGKGYVHRVGRTARAGRAGTGVTLVTPDKQGDVGRIARHLKLGDEFEVEGMKVPAPRAVFTSSRRGRGRGRVRPRRR
ncbi:MAG TPA: DEAD/DEAH box helicase [Actinomycetota bacterium]